MRKTSTRLIVAFVVLLVFSVEAQAGVRKGPYLIYGGDPAQMTVLWQLDTSQTCTIRWGLTADYSSGTASIDPHGDTQYEYSITGLLPGTLYYYQVDGVGSGSFRTAPDGTATSVKLLAYGDPQNSPDGYDATCSSMIGLFTRDPLFQTLSICAGDWADEDDETLWDTEYFARSWENILNFHARVPISGPRGNHERAGIVFSKYYPFPYVSDFYWSFDYGPVHIIVLDQFVSYAPGSPQYDWLVRDLATTKPWKIITFHMPGWSAGGHENEMEVQEYIQPLCLQFGIDLVISGHNHYYARADVGGVQHVTSGGASDHLATPVGGDYIVIYESTSHYLEIDVQGREASVTARRWDGSTIETFSLSHGASIRITSPQAGSTLLAGQTTNVQAKVLPAGGTCTGVRFYADGQLIGTDDIEPYEVAWVPTYSPASVSLVAEASINYFGSTETIASGPVAVNVTNTLPAQSFSIRVSQSADDAEESASGSMSLTSTDLELVHDGSDQMVGMRFNGVAIPQGAAITNAYVQFKVDEVNSESTSLTIRGENADQAAAFASVTRNVSSRPRTAAAASWSPNPWATVGAVGADQRTPNIASVIQEIVNRSGWASGNSLAIIITGTGHRTAVAYDGAPAGAPLLHVEYGSPASNHAPVAANDTYSTSEDTALVVGPKGVLTNDTDQDGDLLTALLNTGAGHGTLTLNADGSFTYTPAANYNGTDSFTYRASDGSLTSGVATVTIAVNALNDAPVASAQSVTTTEDSAKTITLTATDQEGDALTYVVVTPPGNGTLTGAAPDLIYTPTLNYNGADSFTFKANDGKTDSNVATVSITVTAVNDAPMANPQFVTTAEDTRVPVTMTGSDVEGSSLTYRVVTGPAHGALSGPTPNVTYTPDANYNGSDSFTFKVNDGSLDSAPATVSITVTPLNDAPVANAQSVSTPQNTPVAITLTGSDVEGSALFYSVVSQPAHGTLGGSAPNLTYTPDANYNGSDNFTFKVNDGSLDSALAAVSIMVMAAVNHQPVANDQLVTTLEDTLKAIALSATDQDGDALLYIVVTGPSRGTLSGTAPDLTYLPALNSYGADSFTFKATDGKADSNVATVSITVAPVNDAPVANAQSVSTAQNTPLAITLTGSDVEGSALFYSVVSQPAHGTLGGSAPNLTYTPAGAYTGPDSFNFSVNDGTLDSAPATVMITVQPLVNQAPVVNAGPDKTVVYPNGVLLSGTASDDRLPYGTLTITWSKVSGPAGKVAFSSPNAALTTATFPRAGSYTLRLTAYDGALSSSDDVVVTVRKK